MSSSALATFFNDIVNNLANLTWAGVSERLSQIRLIFTNPTENPEMLLAFGGLGVLVLLAVAVLAALLFLTMKSKSHEDEYEYVLVDEDGVETVIDSSKPLGGLTATVAPIPGLARDPLSAYKWLLFAIPLLICAWLLFGVASQSDAACKSCHQLDATNQAMVENGHQNVRCVTCHESGNVVQRASINLIPRVAHMMGGLRDESTPQTRKYQTVSSDACLRCHDNDAIDRVTATSGYNTIRMSHREPLAAGMTCIDCHFFTQKQSEVAAFSGMPTCITCHDGTRLDAQCATCHVVAPTAAGTSGASPSNAQALLQWRNPQQGCYGCHDPGPCDACHGLRIPHSNEFMATNTRPFSQQHIDATYQIGVQRCQMCHTTSSPTGIAPCTDCHSGIDDNPTFP